MAEDKDFRDGVLKGAGHTERDTVPGRAAAAFDFFCRAQESAVNAELSAQAAVTKAQAQLAGAQLALDAALTARAAAEADVSAASRLVTDIKAGADVSAHTGQPEGDVRVHAGVARGSGEARS